MEPPSSVSAEIHGIISGCCLPTVRPLYLILFKRPAREAYTNSSQYACKNSYPLSQISKTRKTARGSAQRDEDITVPSIRHPIELDVTYEPIPPRAHQDTWTTNLGNAAAT